MKSKKVFFTCFLLLCVCILTACGTKQPTGNPIGEFTFVDQNEKPFGSDDLSGKVWLADFIFTDCETVCPPMTAEMASLQKQFEKEGIAVELVSFTVDPTVDDSATFKKYIKQFTDDESNWHLLTGYSQEAIEQFARVKFQTIVQKPGSSTQVIHGTSFYLINQHGYMVNEYNFVDSSYADKLMQDIRKLR